MGDSGPQQDPQGHAQNLGLLLGKLLRIDVDHRDGDKPDGKPYSVPPVAGPFEADPSRPDIAGGVDCRS